MDTPISAEVEPAAPAALTLLVVRVRALELGGEDSP